MRIRQTKYQRRMMCLLLICTWSFASMIMLWRKVFKDSDEAINKTAGTHALSGYGKILFQHNFWKKKRKEKMMDKIDEESISGTGVIMEEPTAKLRKRIKARVDYGQNRDLDVEGVHDYIMWYENFQNADPQLPTLPRQLKCTRPLQNIAFLKTHFTGSDVITNILNRYGDLNNLNIALPSDGLSTFYWPMRFQWKYIDITLLNGSLPNIISNHARYNNDVMDNILNPGSVYITILRNPITQLETTFNNLGFGGLLQVTNTTDQLLKFLDDPKFYIQGVIKRKRFKDTLNLIKNAQFFDLGLPTTEYHKRHIIKATIQELYEKFTVVLIYEYLDESLLLMKRKFCWQLDDILYMKFHYTSNNIWNRYNFSEELTMKIRQWNQADHALYEYFNKTLWEEIKYEGESFWKELKLFKNKLKQIEHECIDNGENNYSSHMADKRFNLDEIPEIKRQTSLTQNYNRNEKNTKINIWNKIKSKTLKELMTLNATSIFNTPPYADEELSSPDNMTLNNMEDIQGGSGGQLLSLKSKSNDKPINDMSAPIMKKTKLSKNASPWNYHFCGKLLMTEAEYLSYFRRKHAYAKAAARKV